MNPDLDRAFELAHVLGVASSCGLAVITREGPPWSKSRPRFARTGHTYADPADRDAEEVTGGYIKRVMKEPLTGNVALGCIFYRPNRQRIDVDNMLKHVCDSANGIAWLDDSQCTAITGIAEFDPERPRTVIMIARHVSTLLRGTDAVTPCQVCGEPVKITSPSIQRKTCSRACRNVLQGARANDRTQDCPECGRAFTPTSAGQKLCSVECRDRRRRQPRPRARALSVCLDCGATLPHNRAGRCRTCWRAKVAQTPVDF